MLIFVLTLSVLVQDDAKKQPNAKGVPPTLVNPTAMQLQMAELLDARKEAREAKKEVVQVTKDAEATVKEADRRVEQIKEESVYEKWLAGIGGAGGATALAIALGGWIAKMSADRHRQHIERIQAEKNADISILKAKTDAEIALKAAAVVAETAVVKRLGEDVQALTRRVEKLELTRA